jgi:transcriptional regulator with XRE-family HTH domain
MDMTQEELGRTLGNDAQTVARWENGMVRLTPTEDIAIRQIYLEVTGSRQKFIDTSHKIGTLKKRIKSMTFRAEGRRNRRTLGWSMAV